MSVPKISIIIPAYNEENFLPACLQSISVLDYPANKVEVIVIDNGSTDNTCDIARKHDAIILQNSTLNVSGLRNLGAQKATGEILAFVDADCTVAKDWLKVGTQHYANQSIAAWGGTATIPDEATWVQSSWHLIRKKQAGVHETDWLESMNLFVRKKTFQEVGGFDESLVTCEDVDLCYRLKSLGSIINDTRIQITHHGEAATIKQFFRKELWRGMGNFHGLFNHGFSVKELPSLTLPLYFIFLLPLSFFVVISLGKGIGLLMLTALLIFPAMLVITKKRIWREGITKVIRLLCLLEVYFIARTAALFKTTKTR